MKCIYCENTENLIEFDGDYYCEDCYSEHFYSCDDCGDTIPRDDIIHISDNHYVCQDCFDNSYHYCNDCDEIIHDDDTYWYNDYPHCQYCYNENHNSLIVGYHHTAPFTFFNTPDDKQPNLYMGYELEIENTNYDITNETLASFATDLKVQFAEDGSINRGFEIISHPLTYEKHLEEYEITKEVFNDLISRGARGDETNTCGLHIHISREPLKEDTIPKILLFMENYKNELINFARRGSNHYTSFISDYDSYEMKKPKKQDYIKSLSYLKKCNPNTRYMALNLLPSKTIEFRLFKSTLNIETFYATLQFVYNLVSVCNENPTSEITWEKVITYTNEPYLTSYLERRNLLTTNTTLNDYSNEYDNYIKVETELYEYLKEEAKRVPAIILKKLTSTRNKMINEGRTMELIGIESHIHNYLKRLSELEYMNSYDTQYNQLKTILNDIKTRIDYYDDNNKEMLRKTMEVVYNVYNNCEEKERTIAD